MFGFCDPALQLEGTWVLFPVWELVPKRVSREALARDRTYSAVERAPTQCWGTGTLSFTGFLQLCVQ